MRILGLWGAVFGLMAAVLVGGVIVAGAEGPRLIGASQEFTVGHPGQMNRFTAAFTSDDPTEVLLDVELWDAEGKRVHQTFWDKKYLAHGNVLNFSVNSPADLPRGTYTWKVGIFSPHWGGVIKWHDLVQTFSLINEGERDPSTGGMVSLGSVTHASTTGATSTMISAHLTTNDAPSRQMLVDVEIYDEDGTRVVQMYWDNVQVPAAGLTRTLQADLDPGMYRVAVGLFSPGWHALHHWEDSAFTFSIP